MQSDYESFDKLTTLFAWTLDQCQQRLTAQLCQLLLAPGQPHQPPTTAGRPPARAGRQHHADGADGASRSRHPS